MQPPLRLLIGWVLALAALSATAGCGFTPLYAQPGIAAGLSAIEVVVPDGRVPFLLREDLDDAFGKDKEAAPVWRLDVAVTQSRDPRGLRIDNVAERYAFTVTVQYTLTAIATGKATRSGAVTTQVSYDAADAPYAGIAARQDVQERAASDAARRIQAQLAAWMASGATPDK